MCQCTSHQNGPQTFGFLIISLVLSRFSLPQNPGHLHPLQPDHHSADAVQHLRLPGRSGGSAAGALQSDANLLRALPDLQHRAALVAHGERLCQRGAAALTSAVRS